MAEIIAVTSSRGGTGKTTAVHNIGAKLAFVGKKVLLIDLDLSADLTLSFHHSQGTPAAEKSIVSVFMDTGIDIRECIIPLCDSLDIIPFPTGLPLPVIDVIYRAEREDILCLELEKIKDEYDYILIDCSPTCTIMTRNALYAADGVIIPTTTGYLDFYSVKDTLDFIGEIRNRKSSENGCPKPDLYGLLVTRFDIKSSANKNILAEIESEYNVVGVIPMNSPALTDAAYEMLSVRVLSGNYLSPESGCVYPTKKMVGRPKTGREVKTKKTITIFPSVYNDAAEIAGEENKAMSELIEELLVGYIKKHRE